jgi:hypothetical protein
VTAHPPDDRNGGHTEKVGGSDASAFPGERRNAARQVEVERIETVPMTDEQHQAAVSALVELVLHWERKGAPTTAPKKAA